MSPRKYPKSKKSPLHSKRVAQRIKDNSFNMGKVSSFIQKKFNEKFRNPSKKIRFDENGEEITAMSKPIQINPQRTKIYDYLPEVNYKDSYQPPSNYFVRNSVHGKVYRVNKPKNNHIVRNNDPTLGGRSFNTALNSRMNGVFGSNFDKSCNNTPRSAYYQRIIPWDDGKKEYVYAAV